MKQPGISLTLRDGLPHMAVTRPTAAEDKIWEAVEYAISEGWNPRKFVIEASNAWDSTIKEQGRDAQREFSNILQAKQR